MKKVKKGFLLALAVVFVLLQVSCVSLSENEGEGSSNIVEGNLGTDTQLPENGEGNQLDVDQAAIDETVLFDGSGIKITATKLNTEGIFGPELTLLLENNSGKNLTIQCRNASINGFMIETMMSVDIVDGKKANDTLIFSDTDLEAAEIDGIADMEFSFHIFTTEDWETYLDTPQIQLKTSIADNYEPTFSDAGEVVYEENGIKIAVRGLISDSSIFGPSIEVYIDNGGDEPITVQTRDVSVNGYMVDPIFSSDVLIGKKAVDMITFMDSDLEENGIMSINEVEVSFHICDMETWDTIVDTDVISITF